MTIPGVAKATCLLVIDLGGKGDSTDSVGPAGGIGALSLSMDGVITCIAGTLGVIIE